MTKITDLERAERRRMANRRYWEKNKEKIREANRKWYHDNGGKEVVKKWTKYNSEHLRKYHIKWENKNRERVNAYHRYENMSEERREERRAYMREYNKKNAPKREKKVRVYRKRTDEEIRIAKQRRKEDYKRWYKKNVKKLSKIMLNKYHTDPHFRIAHTMRCRIRETIRRDHGKKAFKMKEMLGCTMEEFINYMKSLFKEGMTMDLFMQGKIHIDHIKPCAMFDLTKAEDQRACFHFTNLKPEWPLDNFSKGARWIG
jgi:hypothetical protein